MPVHVAITRRVRSGCEATFEQSLLGFFQDSLSQSGTLGVHLLRPAPGSGLRDYGILRTFASEAERKAFYDSDLFRRWERQVHPLTEGEPQRRELHGLEAWFRSPEAPPPRWKMAVATFLGVFPVAMILNLTLGPAIRSWHFVLSNAVFNACVVGLLTWVVMPAVTRLLRHWLHAQPQPPEKNP